MNDHDLAEVLRIARRASDLVHAVYQTPSPSSQGPQRPRTRADREANDLICEALAASFPGDAILAEESVPADPAEVARLAAKERVWFVDPLDGTREFADKNGEFAVMIGLAVAGRAALGVVVMPVTGEALAGRLGTQAFAEDASGARRPLAVSAVSDPRAATLMVSRSHRPAMLDPLIPAAGHRAGGAVRVGRGEGVAPGARAGRSLRARRAGREAVGYVRAGGHPGGSGGAVHGSRRARRSTMRAAIWCCAMASWRAMGRCTRRCWRR